MSRVLSGILLLLLVGCTQEGRQEADRLFEQTRYREASRAYGPLVLKDADDDLLARRYALSLARSGEPTKAEPLLIELMSSSPTGEISAALVDTLALTKGVDEGWTLVQQQLTRYPSSAQVQRAAGTLAAQRGDLQAAKTFLNRALELNPRLAPAYSNLGDLRLRERDMMGAVEYYQRAIEYEPNSPMSVRIRIRLAQIMVDTQPQEAIALIQKALEIEPQAPDVLAELGKVLASIRLYWEAIEYLRDAYDLGLKRTDVLSTLGYCFLQKGMSTTDPGGKRKDMLAARMWLNRLLKVEPRYRGAHNNLGKVYIYLGDQDAAGREFRTELGLYPSSVEALTNLGRLHAQQGSIDDARAFLGRAFQVDRRQVMLASELGRYALTAGDWSDGLRWYQTAFELCKRLPPGHPCQSEVPYQLARVAGRQRQTDASVQYFLRAVEAGFSDFGRFKAEAELRPIANDPRVMEVMFALGH